MTMSSRKRLQEEEGWALVTAFMLMMMMLSIGLAVFAMSDTQTKRSAEERQRESQLNLTEGVLSSQIFALSRNWPATVAGRYYDCTEASANVLQCPTAARVRSHFDAVDFMQPSTWTTQVRDNSGGSPLYYSDATVLSQPSWDSNQDGQLWVRAQGRLGDESRVIVARVKVESLPIAFPNAPFVAGSMGTSNSGGHGGRALVETNGTAGIVRCSDTTPPSSSNPCRGYDPNKGQVDGPVTADPNTPVNVVTPEMLDALRATARANETYWPKPGQACPPNPTGKVVFVEGPAHCDYENSSVKSSINSPSAPGIFVVANGTASCQGNIDWYGVIYMVNAQNSSGTVFNNTGGCTVRGGIFIDGPGRLEIGSNAPNLVYDPSMVLNATAYGTAGIVQNTWREYHPG